MILEIFHDLNNLLNDGWLANMLSAEIQNVCQAAIYGQFRVIFQLGSCYFSSHCQ